MKTKKKYFSVVFLVFSFLFFFFLLYVEIATTNLENLWEFKNKETKKKLERERKRERASNRIKYEIKCLILLFLL